MWLWWPLGGLVADVVDSSKGKEGIGVDLGQIISTNVLFYCKHRYLMSLRPTTSTPTCLIWGQEVAKYHSLAGRKSVWEALI